MATSDVPGALARDLQALPRLLLAPGEAEAAGSYEDALAVRAAANLCLARLHDRLACRRRADVPVPFHRDVALGAVVGVGVAALVNAPRLARLDAAPQVGAAVRASLRLRVGRAHLLARRSRTD